MPRFGLFGCGFRRGFGGRGGGGGACVNAFFAQARGFAGATAQIIELRATDMRVADDFDFFQARRMHKKGAFDADPMRADAAHGKVFFDAAAALTHDDALKDLNAFAVAFDDAKMHAHAVAGA